MSSTEAEVVAANITLRAVGLPSSGLWTYLQNAGGGMEVCRVTRLHPQLSGFQHGAEGHGGREEVEGETGGDGGGDEGGRSLGRRGRAMWDLEGGGSVRRNGRRGGWGRRRK